MRGRRGEPTPSRLQREPDDDFHSRQYHVQRAGRGLLAPVLLGVLLGLSGRRPLASQRRSGAGGTFTLEFDRFIRRLAPADLVLTLGRAPGGTTRPPSGSAARSSLVTTLIGPDVLMPLG